MGEVQLPLYTALVAAAMILLQLVLMFRVIGQRGKKEILIGDGGDETMQQLIRVHGNLTEILPIFLIGLCLAELIAGSTLVIAIFGGAFVVARIAHAVGYSQSPGVTQGRFLGTLVSVIAVVGVAGYLVWLVVTNL